MKAGYQWEKKQNAPKQKSQLNKLTKEKENHYYLINI